MFFVVHPSIQASIHVLGVYPVGDHRAAGAYPDCHTVKGGIHPGQACKANA